jgi:hypothetical protein
MIFPVDVQDLNVLIKAESVFVLHEG